MMEARPALASWQKVIDRKRKTQLNAPSNLVKHLRWDNPNTKRLPRASNRASLSAVYRSLGTHLGPRFSLFTEVRKIRS